jgi:hypothetical protein
MFPVTSSSHCIDQTRQECRDSIVMRADPRSSAIPFLSLLFAENCKLNRNKLSSSCPSFGSLGNLAVNLF